MPWKPGYGYLNEEVKRYDQIISEICEKNKIEYIPLFEEFNAYQTNRLLIDGLHPNDRGHKIIFTLVKNRLNL